MVIMVVLQLLDLAAGNDQPMTDRQSSPPSQPGNRSAECVSLAERAFSVKKRFLAMHHKAHLGHIGSSLSCAELLVFLRFAWMQDDDGFVLSKGHAAPALYSLLAEIGALSQEQIDSFHQDGTRLPAHPPADAFQEIPLATGSLGHGLSFCAGMALGAVLDGNQRRIFCLTSDGELDEGSVWEAALFIAHHKLDNLIWVIDRNRIQGFGRTEDVLALEPLDAKLRAFGFHVIAADGHDFLSLLAARDQCLQVPPPHRRPVVIIANTIKGHGVSPMQDTVDSHYLPMDDDQYARALHELAQSHAAALKRYGDAG